MTYVEANDMKKRMGSIMLSSLLTMALLAGCTGGSETTRPDDNTVTPSEALTEIPLPITSEPFTIEYWRANDAKLTASLGNFGETAAYKKKEELTGIKANFTHPPLGQQRDQFNLLISTKQLPDVIYYNWAD